MGILQGRFALTAPIGSADSVIWDGYAVDWITNQPQRLWRRHSDAVNAALISRWLPDALDRVLKTDLFDEAISEGIQPTLASRAESVVGLDVSFAVLAGARKRYPGLVSSVADVRRLPLRADSFDAVVSLSTLDHFESEEDIPSALGELYRVLRPDGVLILTLDNLANPIIRIRNALPFGLTNGSGLLPYPVGKTHGPAKAETLVREAGFRVLEKTAVMHAPRVMAIPVMRAFGGRSNGRRSAMLSRLAMAFEGLGSAGTRYVTGHFVAIRAIKPSH